MEVISLTLSNFIVNYVQKWLNLDNNAVNMLNMLTITIINKLQKIDYNDVILLILPIYILKIQ